MKNITTALLLSFTALASAEDRVLHSFQKLQLNEHFWSEGASFGDFNRDGKMDIVSGPYWYEGPDFKTRHEYYPATQAFKRTGADGKEETIPGFEGALGTKNSYSDNFFAFVRDFNGDGWPDILIYGFPGKDASWFENPQGKDGMWKRHTIFDQVDNESPTFADINGDGKPDIVCNSGGYFGYATQESSDPAQPWKFHSISPKGNWAKFTHGLGVGDVSGDGKPDIIEASGWWEQPAALAGDPAWKKHPAPFGNGAQFYAYDVNADGLPDVIGSLAAHGYGLAWWEQVRAGSEVTFRRHLIMGDKPEHNRYGVVFSQLHALDLADMDGDGLKDIIVGKRFWAHGNHGDAEPNAPAVSYWFQLVRKGKDVDFIPHLIDDNSGVGTQVVTGDVNGDGRLDVVVGNKKGTVVLLHEKKPVSEAEWQKAQPKANPAFVENTASLSPPAPPVPAAAKVPVKNAGEGPLRLVRESDALTPAQEQAKLHVPDGFTVQLFASEPMINKPINMAFDARGRLWVSSTVEYPYAAKKERWADAQGSRVKDSRDAIKILEDTDGDGKADKVTDFADGLNIPTGVLPWHRPEDRDGCIAWSIPNIWYFADTDGDGKCDKREVLFGPLGFEKDTHGMCSSFRMGADGWVYATHGFNNTSHLKAKDGSTLDLHSGNVFRFRPDGSRVEIWAWGQVNPFGLCWDRRGNLYSADCHSNPLTQLIRGAFYPSFGKPHDGLGYGPVMCAHSHGSTGLCGVAYIDGGVWGKEWDDHMFLGNCVTSKVNHDLVTFTGTTPKANERPDFLTSDDLWFRPVDLQLGPDNALYIADFYNKIIGHYEVALDHPGRDKERGRIWRVVKTNASKQARPAPPKPREFTPADIASADPFTVRGAAAWFADHPVKEAVSPLLAALTKAEEGDAQLRHQLRIAIREQLKTAGAFAAMSSTATEALTEISFAVPTPEAAQYLFDHWPADTSRLLSHLAHNASQATLEASISRAREQTKATMQSQSDAVDALHNGLLERGGKPTSSLLAWATELAESLLAQSTEADQSWVNVPINNSESPWCLQERKCIDGKMTRMLSSLNQSLKAPEKLTGILRSKTFAAPAKLSFWLCGHQGFPTAEANKKNLVRLVDEQGVVVYQAYPPRHNDAQRIEWDLASVKGKQVRLEIIDGDNGTAYAWIGVGCFEQSVLSTDNFNAAAARQNQLKTLATILRTTAPVGLRDKLAAFLPQPPRIAKAKPQPEIDALIKQRIVAFSTAKPDITKGEALFTTNCAVCHTLGGKGGLIGPQLDGIGNRGAERLIEDILDPNRNVDAHFHLHQMKLRDDTIATGFVRGEVGQVTILVDAAGNEQRISKGDIVQDTDLPQSLMPPVFGQTIPPAMFNDLIAWLLKR